MEIKELGTKICMEIGIGLENGNTDYVFLDDNSFVKVGKWWIAFDSMRGHIDFMGLWCFCRAISKNEDATLPNLAHFPVNLVVAGLNQLRAERDSKNEARAADSPPVFPI